MIDVWVFKLGEDPPMLEPAIVIPPVNPRVHYATFDMGLDFVVEEKIGAIPIW